MKKNRRLIQGEENTTSQGREGALQVKKQSMGFFGSTDNVFVSKQFFPHRVKLTLEGRGGYNRSGEPAPVFYDSC